MRWAKCCGYLAVFALIGASLTTAARAASNLPDETDLLLAWGSSVSIGGGIEGFTSEGMRDITSDVGGLWEARFGLGTRRYIGFEAAYVGTAQGLDVTGLDSDALLLGTCLEGNVKLNLLSGQWTPFVVAGLGWRHLSVERSDHNNSNIRDSDNLMVVPLGAGVSYQMQRFIIDGRVVFRPAVGADLIRSGADKESNESTWGARLGVGWEF